MDFKRLLNEWTHLDYIDPEDIPNIELYMDQITTFMDHQLSGCKRSPEDKVLTKTMINNYSKNHLLPPSNRKKYSKEHIILLIYIYYLKNFLSISDIKSLLTPLTELFFENKSGELTLDEIYDCVFQDASQHFEAVKKDLFRSFHKSRDTFTNVKDKTQRDFLQDLSFITVLSYDIYLKKKIIEHMVDEFYTTEDR